MHRTCSAQSRRTLLEGERVRRPSGTAGLVRILDRSLMRRPPTPPRGHPAPVSAQLGGEAIDLEALASEVCRRYAGEFRDEASRYGAAGAEWCRHDNQHIFNWAIEAIEYGADLDGHLTWLAEVLSSRDFPVERLRRNLEIAAEVARAELGERGGQLERRLRSGAGAVVAPGPVKQP